jgi:hypothetical protein
MKKYYAEYVLDQMDPKARKAVETLMAAPDSFDAKVSYSESVSDEAIRRETSHAITEFSGGQISKRKTGIQQILWPVLLCMAQRRKNTSSLSLKS